MEDIIKLSSRGGNNNHLKKLKKTDNGESKTYALKLDSNYLRSGFVDDTRRFVDPPGGPMIVEGEFLKEANAVVDKITAVPGSGYYITFK